jgi:hypothetical protein
MFKWNKCAALVVLTVLSVSYVNAEHSTGLALYSKLGVPQYLVSLSVSEGVNPESYDTAQSMTFIVLPNRLSKRSWRNQWNRNIIINLNEDLTGDVQELVDRFLNFPEGSLTTGDRIVVQHTPQGQTVVNFNGYKLFGTKIKDFYKAIKSSMLGKLPPSRRFKSHLLGYTVSSQDFTKYQNLKPSVERTKQVKNWMLTPEQKADLVKRKEVAAKEEKNKRMLLAIKLKQEAEKQKNRIEEERIELIAEKKAAALKKERALERKKEAIKNWKIKEAKRLAEIKAKERKFALDMYKYQVTEMLYKRIKYPTWARKFEIEGVVNFTAHISIDGEIVDVVQRNSKTNKKLIKEVEGKLKDIVSFIPMPVEHIKNTYRMDIHYTFDLRDETQKPNIKPKTI